MNKLLFTLILAFGLISLGNNVVFAQSDNDHATHNVTITIPEVQLLDIENTGGSNNIALTFTAPTEAGEPIDFNTTDNSLWLNYTSIIGGSITTRRITVAISAAYPGADLKVAAANPTGFGTLGTPAGTALTLTTNPQDLVSGIGSCYTVNGASHGIQLTYSVGLNNTNFANLRSDASTPAVTYTLTDN